jgi:hypothetical protein
MMKFFVSNPQLTFEDLVAGLSAEHRTDAVPGSLDQQEEEARPHFDGLVWHQPARGLRRPMYFPDFLQSQQPNADFGS